MTVFRDVKLTQPRRPVSLVVRLPRSQRHFLLGWPVFPTPADIPHWRTEAAPRRPEHPTPRFVVRRRRSVRFAIEGRRVTDGPVNEASGRPGGGRPPGGGGRAPGRGR